MRWIMIIFMMLLTAVSVDAAFDWEVVELGDETAAGGKHPYEGGEVKFLQNGFEVTAHGGEIWSEGLGCTLVHIKERFSGDFTIEYTITDHICEPVHTWSKFGAFIAQEITPETPYVFVQASLASNDDVAVNEKGVKITVRPEINGVATPGSGGWVPLQWPMTHKLVREGDIFTASLSLDGGKTYESIAMGDKFDNTTLAFADPVFVGFALCGKGLVGGTAVATVVDIKVNGKNALAVKPADKLTTAWGLIKQ